MRWMYSVFDDLWTEGTLFLKPLSLRGEKARLARHWRACLGAPTPLAWAGARSGGWGEGRWSPDAWLMNKAKAFAPLSGERATFLCSCKEKVTKRKHGRTRSVGLRPPGPCAPRGTRGRRTTRFAQTRAPLRPSFHCGARLALRRGSQKLESKITGNGRHSAAAGIMRRSLLEILKCWKLWNNKPAQRRNGR